LPEGAVEELIRIFEFSGNEASESDPLMQYRQYSSASRRDFVPHFTCRISASLFACKERQGYFSLSSSARILNVIIITPPPATTLSETIRTNRNW
jgi:hypothetical protein